MLKGESLNNVDDFLYLGSWIDCCSKEANIRIGKAWSTLHKLDTIWKSELCEGLRIGVFRATVETVLLYESTALILTPSLDKKLDRQFTNMLRVVKNVTWRQRILKEVLYAGLPRISTTIREKRLRFSGHCWRSKNEAISNLVLWEPKHGKRSVRGQARTFVNLLDVDTRVPKGCLPAAMGDRVGWRKTAIGGQLRAT